MVELIRRYPATEVIAWMVLGLLVIGSMLQAVISFARRLIRFTTVEIAHRDTVNSKGGLKYGTNDETERNHAMET
jgi:hypothetical protein